MLNYLIAVVAILIVVTLSWLITKDDKTPEQEVQQQQVDNSLEEDGAQGDTEKDQSRVPIDEQSNEDEEQNVVNEEDIIDDTVVEQATDSNVREVHTNAKWPAYPTAQSGEHVSVFKKGHIDYEEKLKAIFSVLDIDQENSIVWKIGNNGTAQSAIATVYSKDKKKIYRVSIEWVNNEGWKPIQYEVLNSLE